MFSWYHEDFDNDQTSLREPIECWGDFKMCRWPSYALNPETPTPSSPNGTPERYFLAMNDESIKNHCPNDTTFTITFSHFLPRRECMLPKKFLRIKFLPKVAGTQRLDEQIRKLKSNIHVFGHTHILANEFIDGIQYIQMCLKYPRERFTYPDGSLQDIEEMVIWDENLSQTEMYERMDRHKLPGNFL